MSERVTWDLTPAEQIDFARAQMERGISLKDTLWLLEEESLEKRDEFKEMWKIASLPQTFGEAFGEGFGTPSKFISNAGDMLKGVGKFWLEVGPQYVGNKLKHAPGIVLGGERGDRARDALWGMETRMLKQLFKELTSDKPEKIRRLEEQLRAETDPHQIEILRYALDEARENWRPVMSFIGDEFFYFMDKQELMNKIANNPAEVTADIVSAAAMLVTFGGATPVALGLKTSVKGRKALKVLKVVGHGVEAVGNPTSILGKGKKVINKRVGPKGWFGVEKPDIPKEKVSADTPKEALKQAGKQVGEQAKSIVIGKAQSGVVSAEEHSEKLEKAIADDDEDEREVKGTDGDERKKRKFKPGPTPRLLVE